MSPSPERSFSKTLLTSSTVSPSGVRTSYRWYSSVSRLRIDLQNGTTSQLRIASDGVTTYSVAERSSAPTPLISDHRLRPAWVRPPRRRP